MIKPYPLRKSSVKQLLFRLITNLNKLTGFFAVLFLEIYRCHISGTLGIGGCCRFHPSCSNYAIQAYQRHSFLKASRLTLFRLLSCHPFGFLQGSKQKKVSSLFLTDYSYSSTIPSHLNGQTRRIE